MSREPADDALAVPSVAVPTQSVRVRVGIYARVSEDPDATSTTIERQTDACARRAQAEGWDVVEAFSDRDLSAWDLSRERPGYLSMLEAIRAGTLDCLIAWKLDRLIRRTKELEQLLELLEAHRVRLITITDGIDTDHSFAGDLIPRIMGVMAQMESKNISARLRFYHEEKAPQGVPHVGGTRGFGHTMDRRGIVEAEAEHLRAAARRVVAGESLRRICLDWDRREVRTTSGRIWTQGMLKRTLTSPRLIGWREHHDTAYRSEVIPPILVDADGRADEQLLDRLRRILNDPARRRTGVSRRSYLLSGRVFCGTCGQPMVARPRADKVPRYVCPKLPGRQDCTKKVAILAEPLEATITAAILRRLDSPQMLAGPPDEAADTGLARVHGDLEQIDERRRAAARMWADGEIEALEWQAIREGLEARRVQISRALDEICAARTQIAVSSIDDIAAMWEGNDVEWRRDLVWQLIERVEIAPALVGRNYFDVERVSIRWRVAGG